MLKVARAKLHGIRVTGADLNYHGSISLDPEQCQQAGIYPLEFVRVWNKNTGARISTYVIYGVPGSRCCILNGAAARTCQVGDELIITACDYIQPEKLYDLTPRILTFLPDNQVDQMLNYEVFRSEERMFDFRIVDSSTRSAEACHTFANVNVAAVKDELVARGWTEDEILEFVAKHLTL